MRQILFVFLAVCIIVPSAVALEIWAEFYGPAMSGGAISKNFRFRIAIWAENGPDDPTRLAWSSPFKIWGTGDVTTLSYQEIIINQEFADIWNYGFFTYTEGWDLDLTEPQIFNFTGVTAGWQPNSGPIKVGELELEISNVYIPSPPFDLFCIAKGDPDNPTYGWLFDPPSPDFEQVCLEVVNWVWMPCGDVNGDFGINIFDVTYLIQYLYSDGPEPSILSSGDVNNDCEINIFDITYLISNLYLDGEWLWCSNSDWWPCK